MRMQCSFIRHDCHQRLLLRPNGGVQRTHTHTHAHTHTQTQHTNTPCTLCGHILSLALSLDMFILVCVCVSVGLSRLRLRSCRCGVRTQSARHPAKPHFHAKAPWRPLQSRRRRRPRWTSGLNSNVQLHRASWMKQNKKEGRGHRTCTPLRSWLLAIAVCTEAIQLKLMARLHRSSLRKENPPMPGCQLPNLAK